MSEELQTSGQNMTLPLWGNAIRYDKMFVSLIEFSAFLEQRAKKSAADFLNIGVEKKSGWLIAGTDYLEAEMRRVCNEVSSYITRNKILAVPNWNMFLEPWIALADSSKQLTLTLHDTFIAGCNNEVREQANQAYRDSLANSDGLGFGIISSSLTAHFIYAVQAASKEAENKRKAENAADAVWKNSSPITKAQEMTAKAYHETHEPFVLDTLASFYTKVESFIYTGAGYDKESIDGQIQQAADILHSTDKDARTKIVQSLSKNICCGEAVLCTIENGLVDDSFIAFCSHAPVILLKKSIDPIVGWLSKEKRTNLLYNRPVFSEKIRCFLSTVQKVFLNGDAPQNDLYDQILDGAFADEINITYTTCYDLCYFNDSILEKYAEAGTHISIGGSANDLLIMLCNEIHSGKLINLVNSARLPLPVEDGQVYARIKEVNSAIDKRHAEILQEKQEAAEREAERERIEAEELAKWKAEEENRRQETIKKVRIAAGILASIVTIALVFALWLWPDVIHPSMEYNSAISLMEQGKYSEAIVTLNSLPDYKDSADLLLMAKYSNGKQLMQEENYSEAISQFSELGAYKDSQELIREAKHEIALEKLSSGNDAEALELLAEARPYGNSEQYLSEYRFVLNSMEDYLPDYGVLTEKYDENGLLISRTSRSGIMYSYKYDENGRLVLINSNNEITVYTYDSLGNLVSEETDDEFIEYFYNQSNQLICEHRTQISYVWGTKYLDEPYWVEFFEYDGNGNLIQDYTWYDSDYHPLSISMTEYEFDANNYCIAETYYSYIISDTEYVPGEDNWIYNIANMQYLDGNTKLQIQSMEKEIISQTTYTYDNGLLIGKNYVHSFGDKSSTTYYYENGLLIQEVNQSSGKTYTYSYDDFGNLIRVEDTDGAWTTYTYTPVFDGKRP